MVVSARYGDGHKVVLKDICQIDYYGHYLKCSRKFEWFAIRFNDVKHGSLQELMIFNS